MLEFLLIFLILFFIIFSIVNFLLKNIDIDNEWVKLLNTTIGKQFLPNEIKRLVPQYMDKTLFCNNYECQKSSVNNFFTFMDLKNITNLDLKSLDDLGDITNPVTFKNNIDEYKLITIILLYEGLKQVYFGSSNLTKLSNRIYYHSSDLYNFIILLPRKYREGEIGNSEKPLYYCDKNYFTYDLGQPGCYVNEQYCNTEVIKELPQNKNNIILVFGNGMELLNMLPSSFNKNFYILMSTFTEALYYFDCFSYYDVHTDFGIERTFVVDNQYASLDASFIKITFDNYEGIPNDLLDSPMSYVMKFSSML